MVHAATGFAVTEVMDAILGLFFNGPSFHPKFIRTGRKEKTLPSEVRTGYGPRLSAFIAEMSGIKAMSRNDVKNLCQSVLGFPISTGAIQKVIDRSSAAIEPIYQRIGSAARSAECNYIDETSWFTDNDLQWLWAMVNECVAFLPRRPQPVPQKPLKR